jgi:hypothetical protein
MAATLFVLPLLLAVAAAVRPHGMNHGLEKFLQHHNIQPSHDEPVEVRW